MILIQATRNAMANDLVIRNVADLAAVPTGKPGWPSRSLNLEQALAVLDAAKGERLWPPTDQYGAPGRPRPRSHGACFRFRRSPRPRYVAPYRLDINAYEQRK
jgi:hypothetical protein